METSGKAPGPGQDGKHETILRVPWWKVGVGLSSVLKDLKGTGWWPVTSLYNEATTELARAFSSVPTRKQSAFMWTA